MKSPLNVQITIAFALVHFVLLAVIPFLFTSGGILDLLLIHVSINGNNDYNFYKLYYDVIIFPLLILPLLLIVSSLDSICPYLFDDHFVLGTVATATMYCGTFLLSYYYLSMCLSYLVTKLKWE